MHKVILSLALSLVSVAAFAGSFTPPPTTIPEPGALSLLAIGVAAGAIVWARSRKKK